MRNRPSINRKFVHKDNDKVYLFVGYDDTGRIYSRVEKDGAVIQRDVFVRMPAPNELEKFGWTLAQ
jgi:hypothetical protein